MVVIRRRVHLSRGPWQETDAAYAWPAAPGLNLGQDGTGQTLEVGAESQTEVARTGLLGTCQAKLEVPAQGTAGASLEQLY